MFKKALSFLLIATMLTTVTATWAEQPHQQDPEQVITILQETLIQAMQQGQQIGYAGRLKLLAPVIEQSHDLATIIRTALGAHWAGLSTEQRQAIIKTFSEHSIATYADRFDQHDGEHFTIIEQRQLPRERILVRSQLVQADRTTITFDYVLHYVGNQWRIINIVVDGVSDLALKRAEYNAVLQKDDIETLIGILEDKTAQLGRN
jgi:phospholipid transport system substrate-binding protein